MIIACKHLLRLSQLMKQSNSVVELYRSELTKLMNTPEIYGISEQTLFRGYEEKVEYGRGIVDIMMDYEQKEIYNNRNWSAQEQESARREQQQLVWLHRKIVYKLQQALHNIQNQKSSANIPYSTYNPSNANKPAGVSSLSRQSLIRTLDSLNNYKNGVHVLSLMRGSSLVQMIMSEESAKIVNLIRVCDGIGYNMAWREFVMLPPNVN